jgi:5-amino-6-(5-phosphoribosylamino)uracil reductase
MSIDGYIDDASDTRLVLSNRADLDRVDAVRAGCDAILVGANTIRRDNPRLLVRSPVRREARVARGLPPSPAKVTVTAQGDLDPGARFFATGPDKLVYCASPVLGKLTERLGDAATVIGAGDPVELSRVLADLAGRGVRRLLVEGGTGVHTAFLTGGLVDEVHLAVAPVFVGDSRAPRFLGDGSYPTGPRLVAVERIGDVVLLRYALSDRYGAG